MLDENNILHNYGGLSSNNLLEKLNIPDLDKLDFMISSPYLTPDRLVANLEDSDNYFTLFSLNCQSLNAKFDRLIVFLEELKRNNIEFSAICLQETWFGEESDLSLYQIDNYICIAQAKVCSEHGGLIIYLHQKYNFDHYNLSVKSAFWEGLFILILNSKNGKNIYIGNIYRPPKENTNEIIQTFTEE